MAHPAHAAASPPCTAGATKKNDVILSKRLGACESAVCIRILCSFALVNRGGQTALEDPALKNGGSIDPLDPAAPQPLLQNKGEVADVILLLCVLNF